MSDVGIPVGTEKGGLGLSRVARPASIAFFGLLPALTIAALFVGVIEEDSIASDFGQFFHAAEYLLRGDSPYPTTVQYLAPWGGPYPYPPFPALVFAPLTAISLQNAGLLLMACLVVVTLAVPYVLTVRDWRCYGLVLLWPPVISAIQTANLTLWIALAAAVAWRLRDRVVPPAAAIGLTLAAKFFLWPLVVWFAATRRLASAAWTLVIGAAVLLASWAVIGFSGIRDYPALLRELEHAVGDDSYTLFIVGLDLGLPSLAARALWLAVGVAFLAALVVLARRGDERTAFIVAIGAALCLTPIVWLHYFALLLVPVALASPRLGLVWFVPLAMVFTPGSGHPAPVETAFTLLVAGVTIGLAIHGSRRERRSTVRRLETVTV